MQGFVLEFLCCGLLALDIAGAFDNAWHPGLLALLLKMKCPSNLYNIVRDFLHERTAQLSIGSSSCSKNITKGCPQGSVFGPTLWNIIISDLIEKLAKVRDLEITVYADDILLMASGKSHGDTLSVLQDSLQMTHDWCMENKLTISRDKSVIMPMYIRKREVYRSHPIVATWGINLVTHMKYLGVTLDSKMDWFPHMQHLENKLLRIRNNLVRCSKATWGVSFYNLLTLYNHAILPVMTYASEAWYTSISKRAKLKLGQIQRSYLLFITKAYRTVSNEALSAIAGIMPIDLTFLLYKDIKAITRGQPTNAIITKLRQSEGIAKIKGIHPADNDITVDMTGTEGKASVRIYTDGSKTDHHVGAGLVAIKDTSEIYIQSERLNIECNVFQAELFAIHMATEWILQQGRRYKSFAIHVDSKAALFAIKDKHTTHPLAVTIRTNSIKLRHHTPISFHWVKGHVGLQGNERADYLAKIAASYKSSIGYNRIPRTRGKQLLNEYYVKIWNETYTNSNKALHTKIFIPNIHHRISLSLWPNHTLTQFLTNHGRFRCYLHKMNLAPSPHCSCPENSIQTACHLLTECSLFARDRPSFLHPTAPLSEVLKHHIHTADMTSFLQKIYCKLQQ